MLYLEAALWSALQSVETESGPLLDDEKFSQVMTALAKLRQPVDLFFDEVKVNTDDRHIRANRLCLLARIVSVMDGVAIFSQIEG